MVSAKFYFTCLIWRKNCWTKVLFAFSDQNLSALGNIFAFVSIMNLTGSRMPRSTRSTAIVMNTFMSFGVSSLRILKIGSDGSQDPQTTHDFRSLPVGDML